MRKIEGIKNEIRESISNKEFDKLAFEDRILETKNQIRMELIVKEGIDNLEFGQDSGI